MTVFDVVVFDTWKWKEQNVSGILTNRGESLWNVANSGASGATKGMEGEGEVSWNSKELF